MKRRDRQALRIKDEKELIKMVKTLRIDRTQRRMDVVAGKEKNTHAVRALRKDAARILTILRQREREGKQT
ncbi:MAG: 50S ribosomal protein L29 [bacterium]|nr:50S ribosomal protein L29 [bacterium]